MSFLATDRHSQEMVRDALASIDYPCTVYLGWVGAGGPAPAWVASVRPPRHDTRLIVAVSLSERINQPATWNALWRRAREHELAGIFNADDAWRPGGLSALVAALDASSDATVAYGDFVFRYEHELPHGPKGGVPDNVLPPGADIASSPVPGPFCLWRVRHARKLETDGALFDETYLRCADWHLWVRLQDLGPFVRARGIVGEFFHRTSSLSHNDPIAFREEQARVRQWAKERRAAA